MADIEKQRVMEKKQEQKKEVEEKEVEQERQQQEQQEQNEVPKMDDDYYSILVKSMFANPYTKKFEETKSSLSRELVYKLWNAAFYAPEPFRFEFEMQGLDASQKVFIVQQKTNRRKYIASLTDYVINEFRDTLQIDDRFILKAFEHNLDSTLLFILENSKFYNIHVSTERLSDLYIIFSCDTENVKMLAKLLQSRSLQSVNIQNLEYVLRFASLDYLMALWKLRRYIPSFDDYMSMLENTLTKKEWKQLYFFDWWRRHLP